MTEKLDDKLLDEVFRLGAVQQKIIQAGIGDSSINLHRSFLTYLDIKRELKSTKIDSRYLKTKFKEIEDLAARHLGENTIEPYRDR